MGFLEILEIQGLVVLVAIPIFYLVRIMYGIRREQIAQRDDIARLSSAIERVSIDVARLQSAARGTSSGRVESFVPLSERLFERDWAVMRTRNLALASDSRELDPDAVIRAREAIQFANDPRGIEPPSVVPAKPRRLKKG